MEKRMELQSMDDDVLRARGKGSISEMKGQEFDRDRYELARVGKEQVLKVRFPSQRHDLSLRISASVWIGFHDRSVLRVDVYLGDFASVSVDAIDRMYFSDSHLASSPSASQSKFTLHSE
jgi:hypothetical protein